MRPEVHRVAEDLYEQLLPVAHEDEERDWPLLKFCAALTAPYAWLDDLARDSDEGIGWSALMDPDRTPADALGYTAQLVGVRLRQGLTEAEQRARIKETAGLKRGTPLSVMGAAKQHLTGTKSATLVERDGSAYILRLITYTAETPDPSTVFNAVLEQKPAGLVLIHEVLDGWLIGVMEEFYDGQTIADAEGDFASLIDFETKVL